MEEKPFQVRIADALLLLAIVPLWLVLATLIGLMGGLGFAEGTYMALVVFAGISLALYRLVGDRRYGWAIATGTAPLLAFGTLLLVALVA